MSRPLRIEYPGAWYHVMNRGAGRKATFKSDAQREYFLSLLSETADRYAAEWHAYCLMTNHYHLLLRTPEGNLQRIMRHVNGVYTQYFNRDTRTDGPLFRGRYKAILVDADAYWLQLSRYIHRNPLEAKMVKRLDHYVWSSYLDYIGLRKPPAWLTTDYILRAIGQRNRHARYKAYMAGDTDTALEKFYRATYLPPILGDDTFKDQVLAGRQTNIDVPELRQSLKRPGLDTIVKTTAGYYGVEVDSLWQSTRGRGVQSPARSASMYLCHQIGDMRLSEIADVFGLASYASAGSTIRKVKERIKTDKKFAREINSIMLDLTP